MLHYVFSKFGFNPKNNEKDKTTRIPSVDDELIYRVCAVLCYFFVLVIIGIPVWWYTTRVYRAALPYNEMSEVELPDKIIKQLGMPLSLEYDILVTIVNPDPENLKVELDGEDIEYNLRPYLNELSPIADFFVKSQWLYLLELGAVPRRITDHYVLYEEQLPHVITPLEKKLWSHLTTRPCLNLVAYISHCSVPLYINNYMDKRTKSNAFLSPGWGGIYIINPDETSCANKTFEPSLQNVVSIFLTQIHQLFNITDDFELFQKKKVVQMVDSTRRTLRSLAQLLSEIPSIVISDHVAKKINIALQNAEWTEELLLKDQISAALRTAKVAYENAEAAFGDPSLLALLYFPDDQKYAVYIPLFLPVMIPVLMSLITVKIWHEERLRKLKEKQE